MSQKQNSSTYVVCSPKGGVGVTTLSEILATLLHKEDITVTIYRPDSFNFIDDDPKNFKLVYIGTKSIQLQNFGKRINTNCIDFLFKKTKDINIIDLSKESFELLEELSMVINYYIPLTDNATEIDLVIKTIKIIKEFSAFDPKIYLVLNKCNSLDKNTIEKQFIGLFGDKKIGIKSRIEELNVDNIFYIPTSKIFSEFSLTKTNLLDYLNSNNQKNKAFNEEVEHFVQKMQDLKKSF